MKGERERARQREAIDFGLSRVWFVRVVVLSGVRAATEERLRLPMRHRVVCGWCDMIDSVSVDRAREV